MTYLQHSKHCIQILIGLVLRSVDVAAVVDDNIRVAAVLSDKRTFTAPAERNSPVLLSQDPGQQYLVLLVPYNKRTQLSTARSLDHRTPFRLE